MRFIEAGETLDYSLKCNNRLFSLQCPVIMMARVDTCLVVILLGLGGLKAQNPGPANTRAPASVRDPVLYPVCVSDSDCEKIAEKGGLHYIDRVQSDTEIPLDNR